MNPENASRKAAARRRLTVDTELTIYHAAPLKETLFDALAATELLHVDLSGVSDIDTSGLQLLILLKREARAQDKQVVFVGHSAAVRQVIDFCNLAAVFGDPIVIPA